MSTKELLIEFMKEQREFNKFVIQKFDNIEKDISNLKTDVKRIEKRLDNIVKLNNLKE